MSAGKYSPVNHGESSIEDILAVDSENEAFRRLSSPEASPVSDSALVTEESFVSPGDLKVPRNRVKAPNSQLESASFMYWKTNLVPFSVALEDGFYDPGRIDDSEDYELMHSMPPISAYFDHDNFG
jgi:hypothetical protein